MENTEAALRLQIMQERSRREKQDKVERFRHLNRYVQKGKIVFAGSSLMEQFPLYEFLQDEGLPCTAYNRGVGGFTTGEFAQALEECVLALEPAHLFLNIGTNDLNGPDYDREAMLARYEAILNTIRGRLPQVKLYLLAYYPVNPAAQCAQIPELQALFGWRTNQRIREASEGVRALAEQFGAQFLDLNGPLTDENGSLKEEFTVEGMHMYADGYRPVLEGLLPVLRQIPRSEGGLLDTRQKG